MPRPRAYLKDSASARYVAGGVAEAEVLLGSPLPPVPPPLHENGQHLWLVKLHPELSRMFPRFLQRLLAKSGLDAPEWRLRPEGAERDLAEAEALLERSARAAYAADRRLGTVDLFWLAVGQHVARTFSELALRTPAVRKQRYAVLPVLSALLRKADATARRGSSDPAANALLAGTGGRSVADVAIEDGFALLEPSFRELDLLAFLQSTRRFRLSGDTFFEMLRVLSVEAERKLRDGERGLLARVARALPGVPREQWTAPPVLTRVVLHHDVLSCLLADAWGTGAALIATPRLRAEAERRKPGELADAWLETVAALKRFELVSEVRDRIVVLPGHDEPDERERRGCRVYAFGERAQILNNAVDATVLFLDLRGFTRTSEGYISARDLTQELYDVFDAFVPHLLRFGGVVDKFLGDGIMVTWGTEYPDPKGPLSALRAAVLCHESLLRLRREGRTGFKMGVSIHYGRVYVARFLESEETVQVTVIGRNVNLAGRLSSAAKRPMEEDEETPVRQHAVLKDLQVTVDDDGTLYNEGIALSRDALARLEDEVDLRHAPSAMTAVMEYHDEEIHRRVFIRHAGDAKFKGVASSFPVYEVDFVAERGRSGA